MFVCVCVFEAAVGVTQALESLVVVFTRFVIHTHTHTHTHTQERERRRERGRGGEGGRG